ncbi:hypothetical protein LZ30DRAFT_368735, partial [Colletotrichum cereale]
IVVRWLVTVVRIETNHGQGRWGTRLSYNRARRAESADIDISSRLPVSVDLNREKLEGPGIRGGQVWIM